MARKSEINNSNEVEQPSRRINLTIEDIARKNELKVRIRQNREEGKIYFKGGFDLMYVGFLGYLEDRGKVEKDLKELQSMLNACSEKMDEILKKSKSTGLVQKNE